MEALYSLDEHFGRIARARRYAPQPDRLVVLSDHGQTQGATFKQRNGYGLDELIERSLEDASVAQMTGGDENDAAVGHAIHEATGRTARGRGAQGGSQGQGRHRARLWEPGARLPDGRAPPADSRGDRGAPSPGSSPRCASTRTSASSLCAPASMAPSFWARTGRGISTAAGSTARTRWPGSQAQAPST